MDTLRNPLPEWRAWGPLALTLGVLGAFFLTASVGAASAGAAPAPKPGQPPPGSNGKGPLVFVSNVLDQSVTVVEPARDLAWRVPVGALPHNFSLSPDGREALVTNTGSESVSFFDTRTGAFKRTLLIGKVPDIPPHRKLGPAKFKGLTSCHVCHGPNAMGTLPSQATYTQDGKSLWTVPFNPPGLFRVDVQTGKRLQAIDLEEDKHPFPLQPANIQYTPDGKQLIVVHRKRDKFKLPGGKAGYSMMNAMGGFEHGAPSGKAESLVTFHTPDLKRLLGEVVVPEALPYKMDFSRDGTKLYIAYRSTNKVAEIDIASRKVTRMLVVGEGPTNALVDRRDGKWLYAPSFYDDPPDVSKMELATGKVRALLPAKVSPTTVGQDKDTGLLYIVINAGARLLEVDPAGKGKILREWPLRAFPLDVLVVSESERKGRR